MKNVFFRAIALTLLIQNATANADTTCSVNDKKYRAPTSQAANVPSFEKLIAGTLLPSATFISSDPSGTGYLTENPADGFLNPERYTNGAQCSNTDNGLDPASNYTRKASTKCEQPKMKVFYLNGMNTERGIGSANGANAQALVLRDLLGQENYDVENLYVETAGFVSDLTEAMAQRTLAQCANLTPMEKKNIYRIWRGFLRTGIYEESTGIDAYCGKKIHFEDAQSDAAKKSYKDVIEKQQNFPQHVSRYNALIAEKRPFVIIGYSQGSLYSNMAYQAIQANYPDYPVAVFQVGTVTDYVGGMDKNLGSYLTLNQDLIVNLIRRAYPDTLPGNFDFNAGGLSHRFPDYFIDNAAVTNEVIGGIKLVSARLPLAECPKPSPIACGGKISAAGSSGRKDFAINLGNDAGSVEIEFEAFDIPDSFDINSRASAKSIYSTGGQVSGFYKKIVNFKGNADGSAETWDVKIVGNVNNSTQWTVAVGCPGQKLRAQDRPAQREAISVTYGNNAGVNNASCSLVAQVDGQQVYRSGFSGSHAFSLLLTKGDHIYSWSSQCQSTCGPSGCDRTFNDNNINRSGAKIISLPDLYYSRQGSVRFSTQ